MFAVNGSINFHVIRNTLWIRKLITLIEAQAAAPCVVHIQFASSIDETASVCGGKGAENEMQEKKTKNIKINTNIRHKDKS